MCIRDSLRGHPRRTAISIHALLAESDRRDLLCLGHIHRISIHALLAESDLLPFPLVWSLVAFQSTLSLRRATCAVGPMWENAPISIHALLAESDAWSQSCVSVYAGFQSTLSLRRATFPPPHRFLYQRPFQSTLSLRRATRLVLLPMGRQHQFQSTLSLRRATYRDMKLPPGHT